MKKVWQYVESQEWTPHFTAKGVSIKTLVTKKEDGVDVTCMLVLVPVGKEVAEHVHEEQDDILYPLRGKATMWVDGTGFFSLEPGIIVRIPKGTKHKIENVTEELLVYDVFCPALV